MMLGPKQVIYKTRNIKAEFCTVCNQFLSGNGSLMLPWRCECGEYKYSWRKQGYLHPAEKEDGDADAEIAALTQKGDQ